MTLDFALLANSVARLDEAVSHYAKDTTDTQIRESLIQRFGFTYGIAHEVVRQALARIIDATKIDLP